MNFSSSPSTPWLVWINPHNLSHAFNVAPRLEMTREMRKLGWKVDLVTVGPPGTHVVQGVEVLCFSRPEVYLLRNMIFHLRVVRYILRHWKRISVVMFSQLSLPWILPLRFLRLPGVGGPIFVLDTRTISMEAEDKARFRDKVRGQFSLVMNRIANRLADGQTAITSRMAEHLSIPSQKLWGVWSSGVNTDRFAVASQARKWPRPEEPVVVTYIGALHYERNLMALCSAVMKANGQSMNFLLWLYGEGTEKKELLAFASRSQGYVSVFDAVPNEQVPQILAGAHMGALAFPDEEKYRVSSPIKLFEYMGAGLPILATRIACHTDVIGKGSFVFWAEDASEAGLVDALRKAWQTRATLPRLGKEAQLASADWTWSVSASRLNNALQHGLSIHRM